MCGIFGLIGSKENIDGPLSTLSHRGPDDKGIYSDELVTLGHQRLSIIDLSKRGRQPMANEESDIWLVYNGEIYNFLELRNLLKKHHRFVSNTDTEVLVHGFEEWGIDTLLRKVNGMFAFCLYDRTKGYCYLVRDRIGKKPLYYFLGKNFIAFSSETKSFFKLKKFSFDIDIESLELLMGFPFLPDNQKTIIRNVYKVEPGSYLKVNCHDRSFKKLLYWRLEKSEKENLFSKPVEELDKLLRNAVRLRMTADVPLGILLSGGLDSSLITAIASKESDSRVKTINISFPGTCIDEREKALMVAKHCQTDHHELKLTCKSSYKLLRENIFIFDDLSTFDSGLFSTYLLCRETRKLGVKVVLTGEGADELFGGYSWFKFSKFPFSFFPEAVKSNFYYYAIMRLFPGQKFIKYADFLKNKLMEEDQSFFKKIQYFEIKYSLPNHYCMKLDKGSSAASVEARAPFLDYRVAQFAYNLPEDYLLKGNIINRKPNDKFILRKIAEKYLPEATVNMRKKGGLLPVYAILEEGLMQDGQLILKNQYNLHIFGKKFLRRMIDLNPKNRFSLWQREWILWRTLIFSLWFDYYKKNGKTKF